MTTMILQLDDTKADAFREKARCIGREPEQLLAEFIDDLLDQPNTNFEEAVNRVLAKNRDLYRRLA
jgi:antitoxin FitA